ncbi:MAG: hypothetical protein E7052_01510 [Lentisphaerae bacterium]|nr:hypothetical protein [Lentisphaerota bacterium]
MTPMAIGICSGLLAALMQSCSYIGGRYFLQRYGNSLQLTVASLVVVGLIALLAAPFFLLTKNLFTWHMAGSILLTDAGLVVGHWGFFSAQKYIESSRIASLMGLKIVIIALLAFVCFGSRFSAVQLAAMAVAVVAGVLINYQKGRLNWSGMGYIFLALIGYCFSDLGVQMVVENMQAENTIAGGVSGFIVNYIVSGVGAALLMKKCRIERKMLRGAIPQALCWVVSMLGLYVCFGIVGAAFGNVLQASRGVISVLLGVGLSWAGWQALEQKASASVWLLKGLAAVMMFGAIVLYALNTKG